MVSKHAEYNAVLKRHLLPTCLLALLAYALVWRSFQGFDWTDETYYAAISYRIVQGDPMFSASWDIHQLSGMLEAPIVWVYVVITGGTSGIILYLRLVYDLLCCIVVVVAYRAFVDETGRFLALTAAVLPIICVNPIALSYNTMQLFSFFLSFSAMIMALRCSGKRRVAALFAAGFLSGVGVIAYPTTILSLPLYAAFIMAEPAFGVRARVRARNLSCFALGGLLCLAAMLGFIAINSSFEAVADNWRYLFLDPQHKDHVFSLREHVVALYGLLGGKVFCVLIASLLLAALSSQVTWRNLRICLSVLAVAGIVIVVAVQYSRCMGDFSHASIQFKMFFALATVGPIAFAFSGFKWHWSIWLFLLGALLSVAVNMGTNNKVNMWIYPYALSASAVVLYVSTMRGLTPLPIFRLLQGAIAVAVFVAGMSFFSYVYRDAPLDELDSRLTVGPGAGLVTTQEQSEKYNRTITAIAEYMPQDGSVLYIKLLPFGYLCTDALPASPRLWTTNLDYDLFAEYYDENPDKLPNAIYIVDEDYALSNSDVKVGDFFARYLTEREHRIVECEAATVVLFD